MESYSKDDARKALEAFVVLAAFADLEEVPILPKVDQFLPEGAASLDLRRAVSLVMHLLEGRPIPTGVGFEVQRAVLDTLRRPLPPCAAVVQLPRGRRAVAA